MVEVPMIRKETRKGRTVEETWQWIRQGLSIQETALRRGLTGQTIVGHVERLILDGRDIDIDRFARPEVKRLLEELLKARGLGMLRDIVEAAPIPVSYDEARLVRAWVRSKGVGR